MKKHLQLKPCRPSFVNEPSDTGKDRHRIMWRLSRYVPKCHLEVGVVLGRMCNQSKLTDMTCGVLVSGKIHISHWHWIIIYPWYEQEWPQDIYHPDFYDGPENGISSEHVKKLDGTTTCSCGDSWKCLVATRGHTPTFCIACLGLSQWKCSLNDELDIDHQHHQLLCHDHQ